MSQNGKWRLRPLRIPSGWAVRWNTFYDIDPSRLSEEDRKMLSDDMLLVENESVGVLLDLGWYWHSQEYGLGAYRLFKDAELARDSWRNPLAEFRTRSTDEAAQ